MAKSLLNNCLKQLAKSYLYYNITYFYINYNDYFCEAIKYYHIRETSEKYKSEWQVINGILIDCKQGAKADFVLESISQIFDRIEVLIQSLPKDTNKASYNSTVFNINYLWHFVQDKNYLKHIIKQAKDV